ncbi:hypothetical protein CC86DRAFT_403949 [Ophiobolus disseminans]|uniref:F-box domain-containing protein n=1 Tax=Ophiobolus disseminans TaxID=1469910 RepID=A0A6A7A9L3_9PLEO|nr:hypothetical protein CC86DRAFT_403949 [Ophiobolus disseminans]
MGNEQSILGDREPVVESAQPLQLLGRLDKHTYRCSSRGQHIYQRPDRGEARKSSIKYPWQHSLLDLPADVRGGVYAHLLLFHDKIQINPSEVTNVPGLTLLQTCRQLHDEAAAFFYASNTFHCLVKKILPTQRASTRQPQYPSFGARLDTRALRDPLNITSGIFFPAPRYHEHLTHLVIRIDTVIAHFDTTSTDSPLPTFTKPELETGLTRIDMDLMHRTVRRKLLRVYRRINDLWQEKEGAWTGRLVLPERTSWASALVYEIEFNGV